MRINIYSQELTKEICLVYKDSNTGIRYYGVRFYLASPEVLHHTPEDDDRSAITFWIPNNKTFSREDLARVFDYARVLTEQDPDPLDYEEMREGIAPPGEEN
jgi:hypothetical protein